MFRANVVYVLNSAPCKRLVLQWFSRTKTHDTVYSFVLQPDIFMPGTRSVKHPPNAIDGSLLVSGHYMGYCLHKLYFVNRVGSRVAIGSSIGSPGSLSGKGITWEYQRIYCTTVSISQIMCVLIQSHRKWITPWIGSTKMCADQQDNSWCRPRARLWDEIINTPLHSSP